MKRFLLTLGVIFMTLGMGPAMAEEIGSALTRLLTNPPAEFVALRAEKTSDVWPIWNAKAFLPGAICVLRGDQSDPQQELKCTLNDKAAADVTSRWYKNTAAAIDAVLPTLPHGSQYERKAESANGADGFQGVKTFWIYDNAAEKIEIELTDDRIFGFSQNTLSVRYLKR